jgi:hypothetical protein
MPLLDPGLDCYTTQSSSYSSSSLARSSLLAICTQPSTLTYISTSNFARRPNLSQLTKPHDNKSNPYSEPTKTKFTPTIFHFCVTPVILLLPRPLSLPIVPPLALPLPHFHDIMLSQPRNSNPAISAARLGSSLPQPCAKLDPGPTTHPSDQPSNIFRDTFTPYPPSPKTLITWPNSIPNSCAPRSPNTTSALTPW